MAWYVYIVECADGTLYTGVATDVARRLEEHNGAGAKGKGARYTATRRPVTLRCALSCEDRSTAMREEYRIKQLTRGEKLLIISTLGTRALEARH
ncbi:MAG: GIY-YIG nuclease family protein [Pseudomonadota bacterium]